jgi:alpha-L-rhamnosidase
MGQFWNRRVFLKSTTAGVGAGFTALPSGPAAAANTPARGPEDDRTGALRIERTTVEYAERLLGTDVELPRLSWEPSAPGQDARQSAYQVQVALDSRELTDRTGAATRLVWDSGKVASDV